MKRYHLVRGLILMLAAIVLTIALAQSQSAQNSLTGNWASETPSNDGYIRKSYFNLKNDGDKITGTIRATQFYYTIKESTGSPEAFTLTASMMDGKSERKVTYEGKFVNGELIIGRRNRPEQPVTFLPAYRVPNGEGALPARIEPPAIHPVKDNGLARRRWAGTAGTGSQDVSTMRLFA